MANGSLPLQDGTFDKQWSAQLGGEVTNMVLADSEIYVAVERGTALDVAAVDLVEGTVRWTVTLTDAGEWSHDFNLAVTTVGLMTSYENDGGGHLVLLDRSSGREMWDTPIEHNAYDLFGEIADGVGAIQTSEDSNEIVNLQTGALSTNFEFSFVVDDKIVARRTARRYASASTRSIRPPTRRRSS